MKRQTLIIAILAFCVMHIFSQNNVITYTANNKIKETDIPLLPGLVTDAFNVPIKYHTFSNGKGIIVFDGELTTIGFCAFSNSKLISITIPNSVTYIGDFAFAYCGAQHAIYNANCFAYLPPSYSGVYVIPNGIKQIASSAFANCKNLTSVKIPSSVISIGCNIFERCNITTPIYNSTCFVYLPKSYKGKYIVPNGIRKISGFAFGNCEELTDVILPNSLTEIDDEAFRNCTMLSSIKLPSNVIKVGDLAFYKCSLITTPIYNQHCFAYMPPAYKGQYTIPSGIESIAGYAFVDCAGLTKITMPNTLKSIGNHAFQGCVNLSSINIPNTVNYIGCLAFENCDKLSHITIPNTVDSIEDRVFIGCKNIECPIYNQHYFVYMPSTFKGSYIIPDGIEKIAGYAFEDCIDIDTIFIPKSVKYIGERAFVNCKGLRNLIIFGENTSIAKDALYNCQSVFVHVPREKLPTYKVMEALSTASIFGDALTYEKKALYVNTSQPPLLTFVPNSVQLIESNNNATIDANESCMIRFQVTNNGKGAAVNCMVKIMGTGSIAGLTFDSAKLPTIPVGATQTVEIPIQASMNTTDGTATFTIEVTEPRGYGIDPMTLTVNTRAFDAPMLKVVDYAISGNGTIQKKQPFDLQLLLQNTKYGKAEDVDVAISLPAGVTLWEGQEQIHYSSIDGGDKKNLNYQIAISGNYAGTTVPISISIKEKYGKFAENKTINLALNQQLASATSVVLQGEAQQAQREAIQIGALGSVVDRNIPISSTVNKSTFAVIIANEKYMSVASVPFALNDGMKFREYCVKTLGIPEKNIHYIANATGNQIKAQVQWLQNITEVFDEPNIIFYYAGHGIPDESSKTAYLLPVDGIGTDVTTGYKLDNLYAALGQMPSVHTTIFLDACFSGSKREDGMLASARGIAIKAKSGVPQGNMVVFSAAQGDETAYPNKEEGHGMFTYYLLKKLQDTKGDVTLQDLGNYITKNVSQQSILINGKSQTPSVTASSTLGDTWQNWKLK